MIIEFLEIYFSIAALVYVIWGWFLLILHIDDQLYDIWFDLICPSNLTSMLALCTVWPILPFKVLAYVIWLILNTIKLNKADDFRIKASLWSMRDHPDYEVVNFRKLSGQQIDAYLTEIHKEKAGWK